MHGIHNNFSNPQINQIAMEQAALQSAKNQQASRVRAETAEEILKQQDKNNGKNSMTSPADPNGKKKSNSQNFKNLLYSKDGTAQTNSDTPPAETPSLPQVTHIDFKA